MWKARPESRLPQPFKSSLFVQNQHTFRRAAQQFPWVISPNLFCPLGDFVAKMSDQFSLDDDVDRVLLKEAWEKVLDRLRDDVPATIMEKFLAPLKPHSVENDVVTVLAPGKFVHEWVNDKYAGRLQAELSLAFERPVRLDMRMNLREKPTTRPFANSAAVTSVTTISDKAKFRPNPKFTFDDFVTGQSNRLAVAGARAVASDPGVKYNPLFIYGASGLGKTHLLHAVANAILEREPSFPVMYVTAQSFAEDFVSALQNNRIDAFRRAQRGVEVWLLDDLQFLAGKDKTQEEIFHTFNYLQGLGKQIVMCADRSPRDLMLMDERLRSRLESGLVADVQMPDTETRCAIIQKKAERDKVEIKHETAMFLAASVPGNIRVLEGALTKLAAQASLEGVPISVHFAQPLVERYYESMAPPKPSFDQIVDMVGKHYKIESTEIKGLSRKAPIAHARHVAVYVTREILGDSWKHIGALFGNRDHTSMMHGYKKIREMMNRDKELNQSVKILMRDLYPED